MTESERFGVALLLVGVGGLVVLASHQLTERLRIPSPAVVLAGAAIAVRLVPGLHAPTERTVDQVVTVALVCILFDGGMHLGRARVRDASVPIVVVGVVGTFLTAVAGALLLHLAFGLEGYPALLVATAVAPTDPAVVFSVLGRRRISGRAGTILEGESGANDPVGIALMASLLAAGGLDAGAVGRIGEAFATQMGVGAAIGLLGGGGLLLLMRRVPLPSEGLYPMRTLVSAVLLYGAAALAHGSGFLAVFLAGIVVGDEPVPQKGEIERFHGALAALAEAVAFVVLGLTVDLRVLERLDVWLPGLLFGAALAAVIRPAVVRLCLLGVRLRPNERRFVLFAGLKGAVPILLGGELLAAHVPQAHRLYGMVVVVVVLSVVVQGGLVPTVARLLRLPVRVVEPRS